MALCSTWLCQDGPGRNKTVEQGSSLYLEKRLCGWKFLWLWLMSPTGMLKLSHNGSSSWRAGQQAQTSQSRIVLPACGMMGGPMWAFSGLGRASTGPCCPQCRGNTLGLLAKNPQGAFWCLPGGEWWDLQCPGVCSFLTLLTVAIHSFASENCNLSLSFSTLGNPVISQGFFHLLLIKWLKRSEFFPGLGCRGGFCFQQHSSGGGWGSLRHSL